MSENSGTVLETEQSEELEKEIKEPSRYKVLLHDDDITTMQFVVDVLRQIFQKSQQEAEELMLKVHETGIGVCGIYTREIAEAKVCMVHKAAWQAGYPLKCTMEKA